MVFACVVYLELLSVTIPIDKYVHGIYIFSSFKLKLLFGCNIVSTWQ
jgi:hypothetical protein